MSHNFAAVKPKTPKLPKITYFIVLSLTSRVLAGLIVMFPEAWDLDVLADGGGSVDMILNGAFASNLMVSGVSVVLPSTNRWISGVLPPSW